MKNVLYVILITIGIFNIFYSQEYNSNEKGKFYFDGENYKLVKENLVKYESQKNRSRIFSKLLINNKYNISTRVKKNVSSNYIVDSLIIYKINGNNIKHVYKYNQNNEIMSEVISETRDGVIWIETLRYTYVYDNESLISFLEENNEVDGWRNSFRITYSYNSNHIIISQLNEIWDGEKWKNIRRYTYTYDESGIILLNRLYENWDGINWTNYEKWKYTYNSHGKITIELKEIWEDNSWLLKTKTENNYDEYQILTTRVVIWDEFKYTYTYSSNENLISEIWEKLHNDIWAEEHMISYLYDSDDNLITKVYANWEENSWVNVDRYFFNYDTNGLLILEAFENWENNDWQNSLRYVYTYDNSFNIIEKISESWTEDYWKALTRKLYNYDSENNLVSLKNQYFDNGTWIGREEGIDFYDSFDRKYHFYGTEAKIYYGILTNIKKNSNLQYEFSLSQNYPNPFNPQTTMSYQLHEKSIVNLTVYNSIGQKVVELVNQPKDKGIHKVDFNASNLSSGMYIYRLQVQSLESNKNYLASKKLLFIK